MCYNMKKVSVRKRKHDSSNSMIGLIVKDAKRQGGFLWAVVPRHNFIKQQ